MSVNTTGSGIFRVRVGKEYAIAGETKVSTSTEVDKLIGFFLITAPNNGMQLPALRIAADAAHWQPLISSSPYPTSSPPNPPSPA